jgi:quercetin dioxygenase-like cupin family protein
VTQPSQGPWEPIVDAIGPRVREARQRLGLSLQQLAVRADVSAAAVHKVERGDMVPTITTLLKLSGALGTTVASLVDELPGEPVARYVRAGARGNATLRAGGVMAVVEPGGESGDTRPRRPGEELLLVLEGALRVEVAGERYDVEPGDTLHYPTDRGHRWSNEGDEPARAVWVTIRA